MACKRMGYRELRRTKAAEKYKEKREKLLLVVKNKGLQYSYDEILDAQRKLRKIPKDASPVRQRKRCCHIDSLEGKYCGRPRGINSLGLCKSHMRLLSMKGELPGLRKASW